MEANRDDKRNAGYQRNTRRGAFKILLLSTVVFAVAFALRRAFFSNVVPIAWESEPPANGALEMAFLLRTVENVGAAVAVIALIVSAVLWVKAR